MVWSVGRSGDSNCAKWVVWASTAVELAAASEGWACGPSEVHFTLLFISCFLAVVIFFLFSLIDKVVLLSLCVKSICNKTLIYAKHLCLVSFSFFSGPVCYRSPHFPLDLICGDVTTLNVNKGEIRSPVSTLAKGEWSVLIIATNFCLNPKCFNTVHVYSHSSLSKAFSASCKNTAHGLW